nr:capsid protein [Picobirnavirus sp.]AVD96991.1 capsid protein [Picobirnavirus sp.]
MSRNRNRNGKSSSGNNSITERSGSLLNVTDSSLVRDSANLNYSFLPGSPLLSQYDAAFSAGNMYGPSSVPGLMLFKLTPNIGVTNKVTDPINLSAMQIYRKVRSVNSGAKNYDANNLMIYLMSMDSIYSYHAWMLRIYGVASLYTSKNYYYPDMLVTAMGVDPDDLRSNSLKLKRYIELYAKRANTICVPAVFPIIMEHAALYSNVYTDAKSILSQNYMFCPEKLYRYIENASAGEKFGTLRLYNTIGSYGDNPVKGGWKIDDIIEYGDTLLEDALSSEDFAIMSGDVQKAYETNLLTLPSDIDDNYTVEIVYDEDVLLAIHNADVQSGFSASEIAADPTSDRITQTLSCSITKSSMESALGDTVDLNTKRIYDMHKENPTAMDNLVASRFKCILNPTPTVTPAANVYTVKACGPDVITHVLVFYFSSRGMELATVPMNMKAFTDDSISNEAAIRYISLTQYFDMAPIMHAHNYITVTGTSTYDPANQVGQDIIGDIYNPTLVDSTTIENMLVAYFMQLFNV